MRARRSCSPAVALTAVLYGLLAAPVLRAGDDAPLGDPAIPPGEEDLIATMLGRGRSLQYCTLVRAGVEYTVIKATYDCLGGEVTLQLDHPRNATANSTRTGQFAITLRSGAPTPGFQDDLASLVRSREAGFQWSWPLNEPPAEDGGTAE